MPATSSRDERHRPQSEIESVSFFELAPIGMFQSTGEGRLTRVNAALARMLGYPDAEAVLTAKRVDDLYVDPRQQRRLWSKPRLLDDPSGVEILWKRRDGTPVQVNIHARPVRGARGRIVRFEGVVCDLTAARRADEPIRQAKREWEAAVDAVSDLIIMTDSAGVVRRCNLAVSRALNASYHNLVGRPVQELLCGSTEPQSTIFQDFHSGRALASPHHEELQLPRLDGWVRLARHPVQLSDRADVQGFVYILTDITERKRLEEILQERVVRPHDLPSNLRKLRKHLQLSQTVFGRAFGGYSQRQIHSYESGESELPVSLLLAVKNRGYSLDIFLTPNQPDAINRAVEYLSDSHVAHEIVRQLMLVLAEFLDRERQTSEAVLDRLGTPVRQDFTKERQVLRETLQRVGIIVDLDAKSGPVRKSKKNPRRSAPVRRHD